MQNFKNDGHFEKQKQSLISLKTILQRHLIS